MESVPDLSSDSFAKDKTNDWGFFVPRSFVHDNINTGKIRKKVSNPLQKTYKSKKNRNLRLKERPGSVSYDIFNSYTNWKNFTTTYFFLLFLKLRLLQIYKFTV